MSIDRHAPHPDLPHLCAMDPSSTSPTATEHLLVRLVERWHAAIEARDTATLDAIWDDTYISTGPDGHRISKAEELEVVASPDVTFDSLRAENLEVRVYGETAVVLGCSRSRGAYKGADASGTYRFTTVFRHGSEGWRAVVSHGSQVRPASSRDARTE